MYDALRYLIRFSVVNNTIIKEVGVVFYGPTRFRFLKIKKRECLEGFTNTSFSQYLNNTNHLCYYQSHLNDTRDQSGIVSARLNFNYSFSTDLNISHEISTTFGNIDTTGTVIQFWSRDTDDYIVKMSHLNYLVASKDDEQLLGLDVRGIELTFTIYDRDYDRFVTNLILVERDINNIPMITKVEAVPFLTNLYELPDEIPMKNVDLFRIVLLCILLTSIFFRIIQKLLGVDSHYKGLLGFLKLFTIVPLQVKNLLLLFSTAFLLLAYQNFTSLCINTPTYFFERYFVDLYYLAQQQKTARTYDMISLYLISIYTLKYIQLLSSSQVLFISLKKVAFEFFLLFVTIAVLIVGLTIFTTFVFGTYVYEYKNLLDGLCMNVKFFVFIENTSLGKDFLKYYRYLSIVIMIVFIFLIRYFLLNLFYPIFIEYFRIEADRAMFLKTRKNEDEGEKMTCKEKLCMFLFSCRQGNRAVPELQSKDASEVELGNNKA